MAEFHVGHIIKAVFDEQGRIVNWFARQSYCNCCNAEKSTELFVLVIDYQMFKKNILLFRTN